MLPLVLLAGLAVLGLWLFRATLVLPYITDDIALLFEVARLRAGDIGFATYVSGTHNEHRIPMLRLLYLATAGSNLDALPLRVAVVAIHVVCAWLVFRLTRRLWSTPAAVAAGVVAVSAVAFSSTPMWAPSTAIFSMSLLFVLLAYELTLGAGRYRLQLATVAILLACLSLNATVVCLPVLVLVFWSHVGTTPRRRAIWAASWLTIGVVVFLWSSASFLAASAPGAQRAAYAVASPATGVQRAADAVANAGFLVVTAPYRWIRTWTTGVPGDTPGWLPAILAFGAWVAAHFAVPTSQRRLVLALSVSASLIAAAIGFGRFDVPWPLLYATDRYYYWFVAPFAIVTVASVSRLLRGGGRSWAFAVIAGLAYISGAVQVRRTLEPTLSYSWVRTSVTATQSAQRLGAALAEAAAAAPFTVRDTYVPIEGVHWGSITLKALSYEFAPHGIPGLTVVAGKAPASDRRLNDALDRWAQREGWPSPPFQSRDGVLIPHLESRVDFARAGFAQQVGAGFHAWDGHARWMDARGTVDLSRVAHAALHIVAYAPVSALKLVNPATSYTVRISVDDAPVGVMDFGASDVVDARFPVPDGTGEHLRVTLDSAFTWKPKQIDVRNEDPRTLSVSVQLVALDPAPTAPPR